MKLYIITFLLCLPVIFHGQTPECFDECFYDPDAFCTLQFDPVCGCDGVEYSNSCFALVSGIPSWTMGACDANQCENSVQSFSNYIGTSGTDDEPQSYAEAEYCFSFSADQELSENASISWDFGNGQTSSMEEPCASFPVIVDTQPVTEPYHVVLTITDGACIYVENFKIAPNSGGEIECMELEGVDFGDCDMILGIGLINNSCVFISGCSTTGTDNVDYSGYLFEDFSSCNSACGSCINPENIDLEIICPTVVIPVCGCDGITYNNSCEAENWYGVTSYSEGPCDEINPEACDDLSTVDFGECDAIIGIAMVDGLCTYISGCSQIDVNGIDYSAAFFDDMLGCTECNQSDCYNPSQVDPNGACDTEYDPVCGCDSLTYSNFCEAVYAGVTSWVEGECLSDGIHRNVIFENQIVIFPNPANEILNIQKPLNGFQEIVILDNLGREIKRVSSRNRGEYAPRDNIKITVKDLNCGNYTLKLISEDQSVFQKRLIIYR